MVAFQMGMIAGQRDRIKELAAEIERLRAANEEQRRMLETALNTISDRNRALYEIRSLTAKHDLPDAWKIADRELAADEQSAPQYMTKEEIDKAPGKIG